MKIITFIIICMILLYILVLIANFSYVPDIDYRLVPGNGTSDSLVLSPASGTIMNIVIGKKDLIIVIFIHVSSSHVQYFPVCGQFINQVHVPGKFYPANMLEKSANNEHCITTIKTINGIYIQIVQVAGILARTIYNKSYIRGSSVCPTMAIGQILLGSSCILRVPKEKIKLNESIAFIGSQVQAPYDVLGILL